MSELTTVHETFTIERVYPARAARVFAAFADPAAKARWFAGPPEWGPEEHELDFRIGGTELSAGGPPGGPRHTMKGRYHDIVADQRIVFTYEMYLDDRRISVSLQTIQLTPEGAGTRLVLTEQGVYLEGGDTPAMREEGTRALLEQLARSLEQA